MNDIETEFFEEFKHLDKLCCEVLSCEAHGVKEYYLTMESDYSAERYHVPGWDNDCKMLKRINWLRNRIAHDTGVTDCSVNDVNFTKEFYRRIMELEDPLAQLRSLKKINQKVRIPKEKSVFDKPETPQTKPQSTWNYNYKPQSDYKPKPAQYSNYKPQYKPYSGKARRVKSIVLFLFIIALIVLIVYLLNK